MNDRQDHDNALRELKSAIDRLKHLLDEIHSQATFYLSSAEMREAARRLKNAHRTLSRDWQARRDRRDG